jgi:putative DNA primase/helicase
MYRDMFTFRPVFKTFVVGNHMPHLASVNQAERRRVLIVPFLHKPANPDKRLAEKLRGEYAGILRWAIEGCLDWQKNGLVAPDVVKEATEDYFDTEDLLGRWVDECCERGPGLKTKATPLWDSFRTFAEANGEAAGSMKSFSNSLANAGIKKMKSGGSSVYLGIALKSATTLHLHQDI